MKLLERAAPFLVLALTLGAWEIYVRVAGVAPSRLPAPSLIAATLVSDGPLLLASLRTTLLEALQALALAGFGGVALAILFAQSRWIERSILPFAVVLQVTPLIAVAPLLLIYLDASRAVLACAFIVAFFPILSNASAGLKSTDRGLIELFRLSGAGRWQELRLLRLPAALPQIMTGLRIGGGLSLIGAVAAELAAGASGANEGLAFRIVEAGFLLKIPRMYAAVTLLCLCGVALYGVLALASWLLLARWHESARPLTD